MKCEVPVVFIVWCVLLQRISVVLCQHSEKCRMYGMDTSCRYKIDGVSLSSITVELNQCSNPVEVTITIKNQLPPVNFQHTFNNADTTVSVPGFMIEVKLQVKLRDKGDDVINVEADFYSYNLAKTDFINDDIKLWGADELCPGLNTAAKISVGVMGTLAVIAGVLVIVLIYIKYQRVHYNNRADRTAGFTCVLTSENRPDLNERPAVRGRGHRGDDHGFHENRERHIETHGFERRDQQINDHGFERRDQQINDHGFNDRRDQRINGHSYERRDQPRDDHGFEGRDQRINDPGVERRDQQINDHGFEERGQRRHRDNNGSDERRNQRRNHHESREQISHLNNSQGHEGTNTNSVSAEPT